MNPIISVSSMRSFISHLIDINLHSNKRLNVCFSPLSQFDCHYPSIKVLFSSSYSYSYLQTVEFSKFSMVGDDFVFSMSFQTDLS